MISLPQRSVRIAAAEMDGPHGKSFPSSSLCPVFCGTFFRENKREDDAEHARDEQAQNVPLPAEKQAGEEQQFNIAAAHGFLLAHFFV